MLKKEINRFKPGLSKEIIIKISKEKNEPDWMLKKRLESFEIFKKKDMPKWGPSLEELNLNEIHFYTKSGTKNSNDWKNVPEDIKKIFEELGIPKAERKQLGGVGAQYESETIYHKLKEDLKKQGIIFSDFDSAIKEYPELIKKYFMRKCISPNLHKFAALHGAVFSGGTFIYVPKGVEVEIPLQAYFRMNLSKGGQFEHTLIIVDEGAKLHYIEGCSAPEYKENSLHAGGVEIFVMKNARMRYSSIENWSRNTYNLNTKRAIVEEGGIMEWVNGNLGSKITMLYPASVLIGKNAKTDYLGIAYAKNGQHQDTGCKVYHLAPNTSSTILSKGISIDGGKSIYRGLVEIKSGAKNSKSSVSCDGLMIDNKSLSGTIPSMNVNEHEVEVSHEATIGKVGEEDLFYLMSRGLTEKEATSMIVSGFIEPIVKKLPLEYAIELNNLIKLEIKNSVC